MTSSSFFASASSPCMSSSQPDLLSPPPSPFSEPELPIIATDDLGMIADDEISPEKVDLPAAAGTKKKRKQSVGQRRRVTYVSRHFVNTDPEDESRTPSKTTKSKKGKSQKPLDDLGATDLALATPPVTPAESHPHLRIYHGINIDELSSDSSLTDVPDYIGPDPFTSTPATSSASSKVLAIKVKAKRPRKPTKSPYFSHPHKHRPTFLSTLPFPPLNHKTFGLMQERLAHDPFRLLIATIFLNKTPGERAMPIFYQLMAKYPTPGDLASAEVSDITSIIYGLGFQNQRARRCVEIAKAWMKRPPERGKRYRKLNYPRNGDGKDVKSEEVIDEEDSRVAWEISHLPGLGPYSHDSWRMFCRDELRCLASSWNGEDAENPDNFEPEWKRVVPTDKELRAYLTWVWMKEGWVWNKETGERTKASDELMAQAQGGGVVVEERDSKHLIVKSIKEDEVDALQDKKKVEHTACDFLPRDDAAGRPQ